MEPVTYAGNTSRHDPANSGTEETRLSLNQGNVGKHSLFGYGPIVSVNPDESGTRMRGGVESGGEKPPLIRLSEGFFLNLIVSIQEFFPCNTCLCADCS